MTFYEKRGRRYFPVAEQELSHPYEAGAYLVIVRPGITSILHHVNPDHAALEAALHTLKEAMVVAMADKSKMRPAKVKMSATEQRAWRAYCRVIGEDLPTMFEYSSLYDIAEAGVAAVKQAMEGKQP